MGGSKLSWLKIAGPSLGILSMAGILAWTQNPTTESVIYAKVDEDKPEIHQEVETTLSNTKVNSTTRVNAIDTEPNQITGLQRFEAVRQYRIELAALLEAYRIDNAQMSPEERGDRKNEINDLYWSLIDIATEPGGNLPSDPDTRINPCTDATLDFLQGSLHRELWIARLLSKLGKYDAVIGTVSQAFNRDPYVFAEEGEHLFDLFLEAIPHCKFYCDKELLPQLDDTLRRKLPPANLETWNNIYPELLARAQQ